MYKIFFAWRPSNFGASARGPSGPTLSTALVNTMQASKSLVRWLVQGFKCFFNKPILHHFLSTCTKLKKGFPENLHLESGNFSASL